MPFCPKCRDEFQDWVEVCPDCHVKLVAALRESPSRVKKDSKAEALVLAASAPNRPLADMWAGILKDKGIRCMVKGYEGGGFRYPPMASPLQPSNLQFDVYVLKSDLGRAKETLKEANPEG